VTTAAYDQEALDALNAASAEHIAAAESGDAARYEASCLAYIAARDACGPAEMAEFVADCPF
jgi:hypothetical protein